MSEPAVLSAGEVLQVKPMLRHLTADSAIPPVHYSLILTCDSGSVCRTSGLEILLRPGAKKLTAVILGAGVPSDPTAIPRAAQCCSADQE